MIHQLKIQAKFFKDIAEGKKPFRITYILDSPEYCKHGYVVMGFEPCAIRNRKAEEYVAPVYSNRDFPK